MSRPVCIKTVGGKVLAELELDPATSIDDVKATLYERINVPVERQCLIVADNSSVANGNFSLEEAAGIATDANEAVLLYMLQSAGRMAVTGGSRGMQFWELKGSIIEEVPSDHLRGLANTFTDATASSANASVQSCMDVEPEGQRLLLGRSTGLVELWDLGSGDCLKTLSGHMRIVLSVAANWAMQRALSGSEDCSVRFWDLRSGACLKVHSHHKLEVCRVALSDDAKIAISGSWDRSLQLFDPETGECIRILMGHNGGVWCFEVDWSQQLLLSGSKDRYLFLWKLDHGRIIKKLIGHSSVVVCVKVDWIKHRALSGSRDSTLRLWDLHQGTCLQLLRSSTCSAAITCMSVDWDRLCAFSGSSNSLQYWNLEGMSPDCTCTVEVSLDHAVHWISIPCATQFVRA